MACDQDHDRGRCGRELARGDPAVAHTRVVVARGPCSADSHWRLVLVQDHGKITVGYKVVQGVVGDAWRVRIAHNSHVIFRGVQVTHGDHGSFAFRVLTRNTRGPDLFRARAGTSRPTKCVGAGRRSEGSCAVAGRVPATAAPLIA